ncbi:MAG TPA: GNAT family N-acetyltransferase [Acidimicrobiales bacterium]|nr:GNAT family N-acetyltransferase [Acidimicrobiales bacterium]
MSDVRLDARIRPCRPDDLPALYDICLRTGDAGEDATGLVEDPDLFGHLWAGPYAVLEPEHALVLDAGGEVVGYVLGALDTEAFQARCEAEWWPPLRERYPERPGGERLDDLLVAMLHHRRPRDPELLARYPSHLHIDLLPAAQGQGWGRRLLDALFRRLAAAGSVGVHWGVNERNQRAIGFYRHLSVEEVAADAVGRTFATPLPRSLLGD